MNFLQIMRALRARRAIALATMLLSVIAALTASVLHEKTYQATASIVLQFKGVDPVSGRALPPQMLSNYMATQIDVLTSRNVALKVVDALKLDTEPSFKKAFSEVDNGDGNLRSWIAGQLLKKLDVQPSRESNVVNLAFNATSPDFAARAANAFVQAYLRTGAELKRDPLLNASMYIDGQMQQLRDALETAQGELSRHQQQHGIVNGESRLDVETGRLNELASQLVSAEAQNVDGRAHARQAASASATDSPDILANPVVQGRQQALANAQARLAELAQRFGKNHPQYQSAEAEVAAVRSALAQQVRQVASGVAGNARIAQQRESELRAALAQQKTRVLELNRQRDEAAILVRQLDNAQKAYDVAAQRMAQTSLEGQANQADAAVLNMAMAPADPACPTLWQVALLSLVFGACAGAVFAVLAERNDRKIRSIEDLEAALALPVLGAINWAQPVPAIAAMSGLTRMRRLLGN